MNTEMNDDFDLNNLRKKSTKKKGVNGKQKGANYERKLANRLNERFDTQDFSRSPGSGAFATTHTLPEHLKIHGDLITPEKFKFCIEAKCGYNKESISSILDKKSIFWKFISQAERDSQRAKKDFLLIIKQNRKPDLAILSVSEELSSTLEGVYFEGLVLVYLEDLLSLSTSFFFV